MFISKNRNKIEKLFNVSKKYSIDEAIATLKQCCYAKFDESFDVSVALGVDASKSDQVVRGTVVLPHSNGKTKRVLAICNNSNKEQCLVAGADYAGGDDYIKKLSEGWCECDVIVTTPQMMIKFGKLGKILGSKGLMPNPKTGGVTTDIIKAIKEIKAGRVEFRCDKDGYVHCSIGRKSFSVDIIKDNIKSLIEALVRAKPASSKGVFIKKINLSSTMGPGVDVEIASIVK